MVGINTLSNVALAAASIFAISSSALPTTGSVAGGSVIAIGGALKHDNAEVWQRIVDLAGGSRASFGVLTAASIPESQDPNAGNSNCSNSKCNGLFYGDILKSFGAQSAIWIPIDLDHKSAAEDKTLAASIAKLTGFFIGGGDQSRYTDLLLRSDGLTDTAALAAMRSALQNGAAVAGTSAGAAVLQKTPMVTGGESYYGVRDGASSSPPGSDLNKLTYRPGGGFGFFPSGLLDTHFAARGRQGRLIRLAMDTKQSIGFGVDEDTALFFTGGTYTVLGTNGVHVMNLKDAHANSSSARGINTARWSRLTSGDSYDVANQKVIPGSGKTAYKGEDRSVSFRTTDVFSSPDRSSSGRSSLEEMVELAKDLVSSRQSRTTSGETYETAPIYRVSLANGASYGAWRSFSGAISFQDIVVDMTSI